MDYARFWCELRELRLKLTGYGNDNPSTRHMLEALDGAMKPYAPVNVPTTDRGDQGTVDFEDGSTITWDWDNGDFIVNGERFSYPYYADDPLFFDGRG